MHKISRFDGIAAPFFFVFVLFFACSWHCAYAAEQTRPCAEELATYCKGMRPGEGRLLKCLEGHKDDLSATCREKLAAVEKLIKEAQEACLPDIEKFCKDIQPGEGRILRCLKKHDREISAACVEKIEGVKKMVPPAKTSGQ
jgi:hypothetical protein